MSDQDDINQANMANYAANRGALSTEQSGASAAPAPDDGGSPAPAGALNSAAAYGTGENRATDDSGGGGQPGVYSPQDQRTLMLLDNIRGQMAPKHTGATLLEGYGQAADAQHADLQRIMEANARARGAMGLQTLKNQGTLGVAQTGAGARVESALINVNGKMVKPFTEEQAREAGYNVPSGWTGYIDNFGKPHTLTKPSQNQEGWTTDANGKAVPLPAGSAPTTSNRTQNQSYLTAADPVMQDLDPNDPNSLYSRMQKVDGKTAVGGPGMVSRGYQDVLGFFGNKSEPDPVATKLRADIADFNLKAGPLLRSGPGTERMNDKQLDDMEHQNLVDPDNATENYGSAIAKMNALRDHITKNARASQDTLQGRANYGGTSALGATGGGAQVQTGAEPPLTAAQAQAILAARAAAKQGGQ